MLRPLSLALLGLGLFASVAFGAEKTVTLAVRNMDCAFCPYVVKHSLEAVPGVAKVVVSLEYETAVVTYDDAKADVASLTAATTRAGYPAAPKN